MVDHCWWCELVMLPVSTVANAWNSSAGSDALLKVMRGESPSEYIIEKYNCLCTVD